jgi:hypothetical protein
MSPTRKNPWKEQLWNVSLLPAATLPPASGPALRPEPRAGEGALATPALLSVVLDASRVDLAEAA